MPIIKMLSTQRGSLDGIQVATYQEGQIYDLRGPGGEDLARSFLADGFAELEVRPSRPPGPEENAATRPEEPQTPPGKPKAK